MWSRSDSLIMSWQIKRLYRPVMMCGQLANGCFFSRLPSRSLSRSLSTYHPNPLIFVSIAAPPPS